MPEIIEENVDFSKMCDKKYSQEVLDAVDDVIKMYFNSLKEFFDYLYQTGSSVPIFSVEKKVNEIDLKIRKKYGMIPAYPTLGNFIKENSAGAYNHFIFQIDHTKFDVCGLSDFKMVGNPAILTAYCVKSYTKRTVFDCTQGGCDYTLNLFVPETEHEDEKE